MICVAELVAQKKVLDKKIKELKSLIKSAPSEDLASELFRLIERKQNKLLSIDAANSISKINIGGTDVTISTALLIRNTIKEKIDILSMLISDTNNELEKLPLQKQRDNFYDEYILLTLGVMKNDLRVTIDQEA